MRDFTLKTYSLLLKALTAKKYAFTTYAEYVSGGKQLSLSDKEVNHRTLTAVYSPPRRGPQTA